MIPTPLLNRHRATPPRRAWIGIGIWALFFSLLMPVISLQPTDATQTRSSRQEQCDQGFVLNERTGECEPIAIPAQIQAPPDCEDGTALNRETGECEPDDPDVLQQAPEECPESKRRDATTGECVSVVPGCPEGTELNVDTGRCEALDTTGPADVPPAEPTQPPLGAEPTDVPTAAPAGEATQENLVTVHAFRCPLGAPPDELGSDLMEVCTATKPDVQFIFGYEADESDTFTDATNADGVVEWSAPPVAGGIFIQEMVPQGYLDPYAFCADTSDPGPVVWSSFPSLANGLLVTSIPETPTNLECHFFNIPDGSASVTIHKWACPPDYEPAMAEADCSEVADGVTFNIDDSNAPNPDQTRTTGDDGPGTVIFAGLEPGTHTVTEELPEGVSSAFGWCVGILMPSQDLGSPPQMVFELEEGEHRVCHWYNVRDDSSITIHKWTCPTRYDVEAVGADPEADCIDVAGGVTFTIDDGIAPAPDDTQVTGDDQGTVVFDELEPGTHTVTEELPPGVYEAFGWCEHILSPWWDLGYPPQMEFELDEGDQRECHWYNVPDVDRSVLAYKGYCPDGIQAELADFDDLIAACTDVFPAVDFDHTDSSGTTPNTTWYGGAGWQDVEPGENAITEHTPPGYQSPIVFCSVDATSDDGDAVAEALIRYEVVDDTVTKVLDYAAFAWTCYFFNIPDEMDNHVTITKWQCPEGTGYDEDQAWYEANCLQPHSDVWFALSTDVVDLTPTDANGVVEFDALPTGTVGVQETIPAGYGPPVVYCSGGLGWQAFDAPTGYWELEFLNEEADQELWQCHVYNIPGEPGSVTIYKWTCPPGYDLNAAGADPKADCTEATNGVEFQFGLDSVAAIAELQVTGDVIDGGVVFDDLEPDTYKAVELVPEGIDHVFVLECTGHIMGQLQPYPLQMGNVLNDIELDAGEHLVCDWYNVPERDGGKVTVIKYVCTTETFVSEIDCEIYEDGATFDLLYWTAVWDPVDEVWVGMWDLVGTDTTDGFGRIQWTELPGGEYWFDEHDGEWCHIASDRLYEDGPWVIVSHTQETEVHVYNCDPDWSTTGKIPEKYPNTGAPVPDERPDSPARLPAAAALGALLSASVSRRRFAALAAGGLGIAAGRVLAQDDDEIIVPAGGTPAAVGTPHQPCLPATPDASGADDCQRGAVPARLRIADINVDAPVEVLETIAGVMQQPSDETHVAWYKETARLGEIGNVLIAGHYNWWGVEEAVFYRLGTLRPGDEVVILDVNEVAYSYVVQWVRQESNLEPPREEVVGMTGYEAVTLITCAGEWDNSISEYDERTVVRAVQVDVIPAETSRARHEGPNRVSAFVPSPIRSSTQRVP